MDEQTDPCEDFYQFTCGRWANEHPRPDSVTSNDWFRERQAHIMRVVREFLRSNITKSEPEAVGKAKTMYRACMDTKLLDSRDLEPLVGYLIRFGLPILPSALNLTLGSGSKYGNGNGHGPSSATESANGKQLPYEPISPNLIGIQSK